MNTTPNRASEYRARAAEARARALASADQKAGEALRYDAEILDRMAEWEDQDNPPLLEREYYSVLTDAGREVVKANDA